MSDTDDDLRPEYDFTSLGRGVRGKYAGRTKTVKTVTIDDDLVAEFPDAKAVNDALREVLEGRRALRSGRD